MTHVAPAPSRRLFLGTTAAGLVLAVLPDGPVKAAAASPTQFTPYIQIGADDTVTIVAPGSELGQGVSTSLPKILCEELEADWERVQVRLAEGNDAAFGNPAKQNRQSTGNSDAVIGYFDVMRKTGAAAREMLVGAAAKRWRVPADQCRAESGKIFHDASKRSVTFGEVAAAAAKLPVPTAPKLKSRDQFKLIGTTVPRKDTPAKVDGSAQYGADIVLPGLLVATVKAAPVFGARIAHVEPGPVVRMPGIEMVTVVDNGSGTEGIAIVAQNFWQAKKAVDALPVTWTETGREKVSSADISKMLVAALDEPASPFPGGKGDAAAALVGAAKTFEATYEVPFLAHACMEPMAATVWVTDTECRMWAPAQQQGGVRDLAAQLTGLPVDKVTMQGTYAGGGFGRKWELDFARQAIQVGIAMKGRPVRFMWSREEDIRHDYYRPAFAVRTRAGFDASGKLIALHSRMAGPSVLAFQKRPAKIPDPISVGGLINARYDVPNTLIDYVEKETHVPVGFWRSVSLSQNGFFSESAIDELAAVAGQDPLAFRRTLLQGKARDLKALDTVAEMSGWGRTLPPGRGLGLAFSYGFEGVNVQVAEVSVTGGELKVEKVWCVYDCGLVVDPGGLTAQMESGIVFGLTAALFGEITLDKGAVQQSNFHDYGMVTMASMPEIEVKLIEGAEKAGGAGEAAVPAIAPAVTNAIFAATGQRIRKLPIRGAGLTVA